jgi:hypothetical protein
LVVAEVVVVTDLIILVAAEVVAAGWSLAIPI